MKGVEKAATRGSKFKGKGKDPKNKPNKGVNKMPIADSSEKEDKENCRKDRVLRPL